MIIKNEGLNETITEILDYLGIQTGKNGIPLSLNETDDLGLSIKKTEDLITISYSEKVLLFRALGLLKEHSEESTFYIKQKSAFATNGVMLDCSRNAVATVLTIKTMLKQLALMGHNTFMLYTEDTYEIDGEPYFGYMRGRYSCEELKSIDDYAFSLGIEVVPCIQTLAHLGCALRWRAYHDIKDIDDILCAEYDKTYDLIEKMISTCRTAFRSHKIHIGMDEAGNLGRGKFKNLYGQVPSIDIMCSHLKKVMEICDKFSFKPMMWNDMFFTLAGNGYSPQTGLDIKLLESIPDGVSMVYWDYYATNKEIYDNNIKKQMSLPNELIFAGGAWKWNGYATALYHSLDVSKLALSSCIEHGVQNVFATAWGDNGADASFFTILPVLQLFAEYGFNQDITKKELAQRLYTCTHADFFDFCNLDLPDFVEGVPKYASENPSKYLLFQDPLVGLFDKHSSLDFDEFYSNATKTLSDIAKKPSEYSYLFDTCAALCNVLALKASIGIKLKNAYDKNDKQELKRLAEYDLQEIITRTKTFKDCLEKSWFKQNKAFGFEVQDIRISAVIARATSAKKRVLSYTQGEIKVLEELEAERLFYDGRQEEGEIKSTDCNLWTNIVTGCNI
ncbi:MAG: beta-N-acetylhexosaminidase [Oscillospiraceae bacterium]